MKGAGGGNPRQRLEFVFDGDRIRDIITFGVFTRGKHSLGLRAAPVVRRSIWKQKDGERRGRDLLVCSH